MQGHREWACKFRINDDDASISPADHPELAVGADPAAPRSLILVARQDTGRRLAFAGSEGTAAFMRGLEERRAAAKAARDALKGVARGLCTDAMLARLRADGFVRLKGAVQPQLVQAALREINRRVGRSTEGGAPLAAWVPTRAARGGDVHGRR